MLPTQELFRAIPCPYYVAGLCERPHCFFRHTKSDVLVARKSSTELVEEAVNSSDDEGKRSTTSRNPLLKTVPLQDSEKGGSTSSAELKKDSLPKPKPVHGHGSVPTIAEVSDAGLPVDRSKRGAVDSLESETKKTKLSDSIITPESSTVDGNDKGSIVLSKLEDKKSPGKKSPEKTKQTEPEHSSPSKFTLLLESLTPSNDKSDISTTASEIKSSRSKSSHAHNTHKHESNKSSGRSSSSKSSSKHNKSKTGHEKDSSSDRKRLSSKSSSSKSHGKLTYDKKNSSSSKSSSRSNKEKLKHNSKEKDNKDKECKRVVKTKDLKTDAEDEDYFIEEIEDRSRKTQDQFKLPVVSDYDDDPDDIAMECLRMFEDYQPEPAENKTLVTNLQHNIFTDKFEHPPDNNTNQSSLKRRTAHVGAENRVNSILANQPPPKKAMVDLTGSLISRYQSHRYQLRDPDSEPTPAQTLSVSTGRKSRIAHVPNVSGLMRPSSHQQQQHTMNGGATPSASSSSEFSSNGKVSGKARQPQTPEKKPAARRPSVFVDAINKKGGKVPSVIRQYGIDKLFDAYLQAFPEGDEAFKRAITEEDDILGRCSSKPVYMSLIAASVGRIRRESQQSTFALGCTLSGQPIVSHDKMVNGPLNNCSIIRAPRISAAPSGKELYAAFTSYLLTESQLTDNGFPRPNPSGEAGRAIATGSRNVDTWARSLTTRTCDRCLKLFIVDLEGNPTEENTCVYHPGKIGRKRIGRTLVKIYNCCSGSTEENEIGCLTVPYHVPKSLPVSQRRGFVSAVREAGNDSEMGSDPWDIVALDCEMVYTTDGMELARATFVGQDNKILYDEIVKPTHRLLDPITHYSGLTEEDLQKATVTFSEVQAVMLTHLKPNSILIGHSLESDLLALKVLHSCVIDTSVLFPHKDTTYKRALRNLASEYLRKIIQDSTEGHDSAEDARTALALVFYKLSEDRKSKIRT